MPAITLYPETAGQRMSRAAAFQRCNRLRRAIGEGDGGTWDNITVERHAAIVAEYKHVGKLLENAGIDLA